MNKNKGGYNQYVGRGTSKYEVRMITDGVRVHVDTTQRDDNSRDDTNTYTHPQRPYRIQTSMHTEVRSEVSPRT